MNGVQVASKARTGALATSSNPLSIGGDALYGQYFSGRIDEVRVYNAALSAAQIQADMNAADRRRRRPRATRQPPTAPTDLTATATSSSQINLSWTAATDNVGVTGYRVERCQGAGCSNFAQIAHHELDLFSDSGLSASTSYSYRVRAVDAASNLGPYSNTATATTQTAERHDRAHGSIGPDGDRGELEPDQPLVDGGHRQRRRHRLPGRTLPGRRLLHLRRDRAPRARPLRRQRAERLDELLAIASGPATRPTTSGRTRTPRPRRRNRRWRRPDAGGRVLVQREQRHDGRRRVRNGNGGTIGTATWTTQGKYGNALAFNGTNAFVTVADAPSLDLTNAMTLEAWVKPSTSLTGWRDVVYKGDDNYYLMGSSTSLGRPAAGGRFAGAYGEVFGAGQLAANTWTHLATTYDGTTLKLYVNGALVSSKAQTGALATSTNALSIGGDPIYGQYFAGSIDEVRVYSTALTQAQVQTDMNTALP